MLDMFLYSIIIVLIFIVGYMVKLAYVPTIVLFHRSSCGACVALKPEWNKYKSSEWFYNVREVDGDIPDNANLLKNFDVKTVPAIWKVYPNGARYPSALDQSSRTASAISDFARRA